MKRTGTFLLLIVSLLWSFYSSNAQNDSLKVLYALDAGPEDSIIINRDTLFFEKGRRDVFFIKNRLYANNKVAYNFKGAVWYGEMMCIRSGKRTYIYIYPFYKNESGPYIWRGYNGVVVRTDDRKVWKNIPFFDYGDILTDPKCRDYFK